MSNSTRENLDLTQCSQLQSWLFNLTQCSQLQLIELAFFNITRCSVATNRVVFFSLTQCSVATIGVGFPAKLSAQWQLIEWVSTLFVCVPTVDCI